MAIVAMTIESNGLPSHPDARLGVELCSTVARRNTRVLLATALAALTAALATLITAAALIAALALLIAWLSHFGNSLSIHRCGAREHWPERLSKTVGDALLSGSA